MAREFYIPVTGVEADIGKVVATIIKKSRSTSTRVKEYKVLDTSIGTGMGQDEVRMDATSKLNGNEYEVLYNRDRKDRDFKRAVGAVVAVLQRDPDEPGVTNIVWEDGFDRNKPGYERLDKILKSIS